jgi:hypothetical protein
VTTSAATRTLIGKTMMPSLPIIDTAVTGLGRAARSLPRLLAIFFLPWLAYTVALIVLEVVLQEHLSLDWAPQRARSLVWAPFAAIADVLLLRWVLYEQAPASAGGQDLAKQVAFVVPIEAAWLGTVNALEAAPTPLLLWLVEPDSFGFRWEDATPLLHALRAATWLAIVAANACFFGLIAVVVTHGRPVFRELWRLLRLRPMHLYGVALLAAAAFGGAEAVNFRVLAWTGLDRLAPNSMIPWRASIHWALASELSVFPIAFASFAVECRILAEAYRRLMQLAGGEGPRVHQPAS